MIARGGEQEAARVLKRSCAAGARASHGGAGGAAGAGQLGLPAVPAARGGPRAPRARHGRQRRRAHAQGGGPRPLGTRYATLRAVCCVLCITVLAVNVEAVGHTLYLLGA